MRHRLGLRERCVKLSPVGKSGPVSLVDFRHLLDGEGEAVGDSGQMVYFVKKQLPALARF
jgi:hypothetical protein